MGDARRCARTRAASTGWVCTDEDASQWQREVVPFGGLSRFGGEVVAAFDMAEIEELPPGAKLPYWTRVDTVVMCHGEDYAEEVAGYYSEAGMSPMDALARECGAEGTRYGEPGYPYGVLAEILFESSSGGVLRGYETRLGAEIDLMHALYDIALRREGAIAEAGSVDAAAREMAR